MTDKSNDWVGYLNTILGRGDGNLNDTIFKSSKAKRFAGECGGWGGGMLKFRVSICIKLVFLSPDELTLVKYKEVIYYSTKVGGGGA